LVSFHEKLYHNGNGAALYKVTFVVLYYLIWFSFCETLTSSSHYHDSRSHFSAKLVTVLHIKFTVNDNVTILVSSYVD